MRYHMTTRRLLIEDRQPTEYRTFNRHNTASLATAVPRLKMLQQQVYAVHEVDDMRRWKLRSLALIGQTRDYRWNGLTRYDQLLCDISPRRA